MMSATKLENTSILRKLEAAPAPSWAFPWPRSWLCEARFASGTTNRPRIFVNAGQLYDENWERTWLSSWWEVIKSDQFSSGPHVHNVMHVIMYVGLWNCQFLWEVNLQPFFLFGVLTPIREVRKLWKMICQEAKMSSTIESAANISIGLVYIIYGHCWPNVDCY